MSRNKIVLLILSLACVLTGFLLLFTHVRDINLRKAGADSGFDS